MAPAEMEHVRPADLLGAVDMFDALYRSDDG